MEKNPESFYDLFEYECKVKGGKIDVLEGRVVCEFNTTPVSHFEDMVKWVYKNRHMIKEGFGRLEVNLRNDYGDRVIRFEYSTSGNDTKFSAEVNTDVMSDKEFESRLKERLLDEGMPENLMSKAVPRIREKLISRFVGIEEYNLYCGMRDLAIPRIIDVDCYYYTYSKNFTPKDMEEAIKTTENYTKEIKNRFEEELEKLDMERVMEMLLEEV